MLGNAIGSRVAVLMGKKVILSKKRPMWTFHDGELLFCEIPAGDCIAVGDTQIFSHERKIDSRLYWWFSEKAELARCRLTGGSWRDIGGYFYRAFLAMNSEQ